MLGAEVSYDRTEMAILDPRTGERIPLVHDALRQRDKERKAHETALARIAELEARLKR